MRPLLFVDVDGTLLPYGGAPLPAPQGGWDDWQKVSNPRLARLNPEHGPRLLALGCEPMWATAWMHDANEVIAPRVGLPELPVVDLPDVPEEDRPGVLHWKIPSLVTTAAGRPFIWIDDEITDVDRAWTEMHHPEPALLHSVEPTVGLTDADFAALTDWLRKTLGAP